MISWWTSVGHGALRGGWSRRRRSSAGPGGGNRRPPGGIPQGQACGARAGALAPEPTAPAPANSEAEEQVGDPGRAAGASRGRRASRRTWTSDVEHRNRRTMDEHQGGGADDGAEGAVDDAAGGRGGRAVGLVLGRVDQVDDGVGDLGRPVGSRRAGRGRDAGLGHGGASQRADTRRLPGAPWAAAVARSALDGEARDAADGVETSTAGCGRRRRRSRRRGC